jgi:hypothetical protein
MYSSCSFDRIANVANNLLNPLHLSIALFGQENMATQPDSGARRAMNVPKQPSEADSKVAPNDTNSKRYCKPRSITARVVIYGSSISRPTLRTIDDGFSCRSTSYPTQTRRRADILATQRQEKSSQGCRCQRLGKPHGLVTNRWDKTADTMSLK